MSALSDEQRVKYAEAHPNRIRLKYISPPGGPHFFWENTNEIPTEKHGKPLTEAEWQELLAATPFPPLDKQVFNAYVRFMYKSAKAYCKSNRKCKRNKRRWAHWAFEYFRYAKMAINLAHQLPVEHRISFERFLAYARTKNMKAFTGTFKEACEL